MGSLFANALQTGIAWDQMSDLRGNYKDANSRAQGQLNKMENMQDTMASVFDPAAIGSMNKNLGAALNDLNPDIANLRKNAASSRSQFADAIAGMPEIAGKYADIEAADRANYTGLSAALSDYLRQQIAGMGPVERADMSLVDPEQIAAAATRLYGTKASAIDRANQIASSRNFSQNVGRGTDGSTWAGDSTDDLVRRFATEYMQAQDSSLDEARRSGIDLFNANVTGVNQHNQARGQTLDETIKAWSPEMTAAQAMFNADAPYRTAEMDAAKAQSQMYGQLFQQDNAALTTDYNALNALSSTASSSFWKYPDYMKQLYSIMSANSNAAQQAYAGALGEFGKAASSMAANPETGALLDKLVGAASGTAGKVLDAIKAAFSSSGPDWTNPALAALAKSDPAWKAEMDALGINDPQLAAKVLAKMAERDTEAAKLISVLSPEDITAMVQDGTSIANYETSLTPDINLQLGPDGNYYDANFGSGLTIGDLSPNFTWDSSGYNYDPGYDYGYDDIWVGP